MSKITYVIEAENVLEFRHQVLDLAAAFGHVIGQAIMQDTNVAAPIVVPPTTEGSKSTKGKKKGGEVKDPVATDLSESTGAGKKSAAALMSSAVAEAEPEEAATPPVETTEVGEDPFLSEEAAVYTLEDINAKLKEVVVKVGKGDNEVGVEAAKKILADFGARNVSAVKEADYGRFFAACEKAMK